MVNDSPAQNRNDRNEWAQRDTPTSALLEEALQDALDAHASGLLAAPFGVDEVALKRARRRALRADIRRLLTEHEHDSGNA